MVRTIQAKVYPASELKGIRTVRDNDKSNFSANELRDMARQFTDGRLPRPVNLHYEHRTKKHENGKIGEIEELYFNEIDKWLWMKASLNDRAQELVTDKHKNDIIRGVSISYKINFDDKKLVEISVTNNPDFREATILVAHSADNGYTFSCPLTLGIYPKELLNKMSHPETPEAATPDNQDYDEEQENEEELDDKDISQQLAEENKRLHEELQAIKKREEDKKTSARRQECEDLVDRIGNAQNFSAEEKEDLLNTFMKNPQAALTAKLAFISSSPSSSSSRTRRPQQSSSSMSSSKPAYQRYEERRSGTSQPQQRLMQHSASSPSSSSSSSRRGGKRTEREPRVATASGFSLGLHTDGSYERPVTEVISHSCTEKRRRGTGGSYLSELYSKDGCRSTLAERQQARFADIIEGTTNFGINLTPVEMAAVFHTAPPDILTQVFGTTVETTSLTNGEFNIRGSDDDLYKQSAGAITHSKFMNSDYCGKTLEQMMNFVQDPQVLKTY